MLGPSGVVLNVSLSMAWLCWKHRTAPSFTIFFQKGTSAHALASLMRTRACISRWGFSKPAIFIQSFLFFFGPHERAPIMFLFIYCIKLVMQGGKCLRFGDGIMTRLSQFPVKSSDFTQHWEGNFMWHTFGMQHGVASSVIILETI